MYSQGMLAGIHFYNFKNYYIACPGAIVQMRNDYIQHTVLPSLLIIQPLAVGTTSPYYRAEN
jgi:hypothetical protein